MPRGQPELAGERGSRGREIVLSNQMEGGREGREHTSMTTSSSNSTIKLSPHSRWIIVRNLNKNVTLKDKKSELHYWVIEKKGFCQVSTVT